MKDETTYTAPAVIATANAVQNTKALFGPPEDGEPIGNQGAPGSVGFYL